MEFAITPSRQSTFYHGKIRTAKPVEYIKGDEGFEAF